MRFYNNLSLNIIYICRLHNLLSLGQVSEMLLKKARYVRKKIQYSRLSGGMMTACI
jgi:hypothetical protein